MEIENVSKKTTKSLPKSLEDSLEGSNDYRQFLRDRAQIMKLIKVCELMQQFNDRMEIQQLLTALYCFYLDDAERTPKMIRETMEVYSSTASRNLAAISDIGIRGHQGYKWVTLHEDPEFRTRKLINITPRGAKIRRLLAAFVGGEQ